MKAVRFRNYGGVDVLHLEEVPDPVPGEGEVVVRVVAAGVNPGEAAIRSGAGRERFPAHFPEGQGSDLSGVIATVGSGVTDLSPGQAVIGLSDGRNAQAELALLPADRVVPKPDGLDWADAATLYVAGTTAVAMLDAARPAEGETVVVSGAAGGVGVVVTQLVLQSGARGIALASEANHERLRGWGAEPIRYGEGSADRIRALAPDGVAALLDTHGGGYLDLALALGVPKARAVTIIDFAGAERLGTTATGMASVADPAGR